MSASTILIVILVFCLLSMWYTDVLVRGATAASKERYAALSQRINAVDRYVHSLNIVVQSMQSEVSSASSEEDDE